LKNLSAYLDGEIPENSIKDIEEHLRNCEKCSEELSMLKTIISALNELEEELPDGFETSLHRRLEEAGVKSGIKARSSKVRLFAQIAAGFVIVLCVGFAIRAGLIGTGSKTAAPAAEMAAAGAAMQKTDEGGFGTVNGIMSARSMITEEARIPEEASDSAEPEMKYFATDDSAEDKEIASMSMADIQKAQAEEDVMIAFSDGASYTLKKEGRDTLVKVTADDAQIVLKKIIEIDKVINQEVQYSNIAGLNKALGDVNTETFAGNQIEVKLLYMDDETWYEFLAKMQEVFPEMDVESAPKTEDIEYIRVTIEEE
jgi:mRNA-degrading endonuclease RelE of RelBE toxin-antitoxin system